MISDLTDFESFMDFQNYPSDHPLYSLINSNKLMILKDETAGIVIIIHFLGIKSKVYFFRTLSLDKNATKKNTICAKGIKKNKQHELSFNDFLSTIQDNACHKINMCTIQSTKKTLYTVKKRKMALSNFDPKRFMLDCGIHSYGYEHVNIKTHLDHCLRCNT
jgi:hypothetical protein